MKSTDTFHEELVVRYLCNELGEDEKLIFESKLTTDASFKKLYEELRYVWEHSSQPPYNSEQDWQIIRQRIGFANAPVSMWGYFVRIAAVLMVVLSVSTGLWVYWNVPGYGRWVVFETSATSDSIVLPDASIVFLNRNSSLKYPNVFGDKSREVALKGEGFFEVQPDKERPFNVEVGDVSVQVLGTAFNLNDNKEKGVIELNVTHGMVNVKNRRSEITVSKGEWALANKHILGKGLSADFNFISWKTGLLEFNSATLREIALALDHHYPEIKSVDMEDESPILVTTRFENADLNDVLEELSMHFQKKFIFNNGKLVITK